MTALNKIQDQIKPRNKKLKNIHLNVIYKHQHHKITDITDVVGHGWVEARIPKKRTNLINI